jgi:hypothetical protein
MASSNTPKSVAAMTINMEFVATALFTLEDVHDLLNKTISGYYRLIRDKGPEMDKCCAGSYSWTGEQLKRLNASYVEIQETLEAILQEHYETNDKGQYMRKSFNAKGLTAAPVSSP